MIEAWPPVQKAPSDVKNVSIDWTTLLPSGATALAAHSVAVDTENLADYFYGDDIPLSLGGVSAADKGATGLVQTIQLSGGNQDCYSTVYATVALADGTNLTRCFRVLIR